MNEIQLSQKSAGKGSCGGIDELDLSEVGYMIQSAKTREGEVSYGNSQSAVSQAKADGPFKGEDPTSKITCESASNRHASVFALT